MAQYCQEIGDFRGAIEFLLMAQRSDEAFNLSKAQNQVGACLGKCEESNTLTVPVS